MRKLLTLAIPILLGVGVLTAALNHPRQSEPSSPRRQAGVATEDALPAVIEESPTSVATVGPTTSTTAAPAPATTTTPAPPKTTTSTAAKPMTTVTTVTTALANKPKPKPAPPQTTTTLAPAPEPEATEAAAAPSTIDCGQGTASARAIYGSSPEATSLYAEIQNESNREIELDRLAVKATYPNGTTKVYTLDVAGKRIQPGEKLVLSIPESAPQGAPKEFVISEFGFHTAGMPECASH